MDNYANERYITVAGARVLVVDDCIICGKPVEVMFKQLVYTGPEQTPRHIHYSCLHGDS